MLLACIAGSAWSEQVSEYGVKAAFIHNMISYVTWPSDAVTNAHGLRLCILGDDPFGHNADELHGVVVGTTTWDVARVSGDADLRQCQVLFIAASESGRLDEILRAVAGGPVLTMGDTDGFAQRGVMVNFYREGKKVRLEINEGMARRAGFAISSRLLRLARIVGNSE